MVSIVVYSVFTAACGFSHGLWELAVLRLGVGLGMGGEWATGAALVSETWPDQHRGKALGLMQSGFAIGYALAAVIAALIMPRWGWRPVFFAGILPALLTLWIGRGVEESPLWLEARARRDQGHGTWGTRDKRRFPESGIRLGVSDRGTGLKIQNSRLQKQRPSPGFPMQSPCPESHPLVPWP